MPAGIYHPIIEQGAKFDRTITWNDSNGDPVDNSGWTAARMTIAIDFGDAAALELTLGSGVTLGGANGQIRLEATASQTEAVNPGVYKFELVITTAAGDVQRLLQGQAIVDAQVKAAS